MVARHCVRREVRASVEPDTPRATPLKIFVDTALPGERRNNPRILRWARWIYKNIPTLPSLGRPLLTLHHRINIPDLGRRDLRMTSELHRRTLSNDPCLDVWLRTIKSPATPLMKYARKLKVRRICGPAMVASLIVIFMTCVNNEVTQRGTPKPLFARDYIRRPKWNLHVICQKKEIVSNRKGRSLPSLQYWGDVRINVAV